MEPQKPDKWFDQFVQKEMQNFAPAPPDAVWASVENSQTATTPSSASTSASSAKVAGGIISSTTAWVTGAVILVGSILGGLYYNSEVDKAQDSQQVQPSGNFRIEQNNINSAEWPETKDSKNPNVVSPSIEAQTSSNISVQGISENNRPAFSSDIQPIQPLSEVSEKANNTQMLGHSSGEKNEMPERRGSNDLPIQTNASMEIEANLNQFPLVHFHLSGWDQEVVWDFGDHKPVAGPVNIKHQYNNADTQTIWVKAFVPGREAPVELLLILPSPISPLIPDVFTPNGDQINDTYEIDFRSKPVQGVKILISNIRGEIVFQSTTGVLSWDGNIHGSPAPEGKYLLQVQWLEPGKSEVQHHNKPIYLNR